MNIIQLSRDGASFITYFMKIRCSLHENSISNIKHFKMVHTMSKKGSFLKGWEIPNKKNQKQTDKGFKYTKLKYEVISC